MDQEKLLARMAQMEQELSTLRQQPRAPQTPSFDQAAFVRQMTLDPLGTMKAMGIPVDHVTRVAVVHALGDQATPEQRALAGLGPQISATNALAASVDSISRRLDAIAQQGTTASVRDSMNKLIENKAKYPNLAKAFATDSSLFDSDITGHKGNAEELATAIEARLAKLATAFGAPPASEANAETNQAAQSAQGKPAIGGVLDVPPLHRSSNGVFTDEDHEKLKAEILHKYPDKQVS